MSPTNHMGEYEPVPRDVPQFIRETRVRYPYVCKTCNHPRQQHSVYRPRCLAGNCDCTRVGGLTEQQLLVVERGY